MEPTDHNLRAFEEAHRRRARAGGGRGLPDQVRPLLPDVNGKHVLHLQCGMGDETAELAKLGALVTGVDISSEALVLAHEHAPRAAFVQADVQTLPVELRRGRFDFVYTGGGVLAWLHDLDAWAHGIVAALRPGGELLLYDAHPASQCLDVSLRWRDDYFDESVEVGVGWTHFRLSGPAATEEKHERFWRLGEVVTAVAHAGLLIRSLEELPSFYPRDLSRVHDRRVPGEFLLRAAKPS